MPMVMPLSIDETMTAVAVAACEALGATSAIVVAPGETGLELGGTYGLADETAEALRAGVLDTTPVLGVAARDRLTLESAHGQRQDRIDLAGLEQAIALRQQLGAVEVQRMRE